MANDRFGKELKRGDLITYASTRGCLDFAVVDRIGDPGTRRDARYIKVLQPKATTRHNGPPRYEVIERTWGIRTISLSNSAHTLVFQPINIVEDTEYKRQLMHIFREVNATR